MKNYRNAPNPTVVRKPMIDGLSQFFPDVIPAKWIVISIITFFVGIGQPTEILSQITCGVDNACLTNTAPANYKCINGNFTIEQLYTSNNPTGQPILLDPMAAASTAQYVIINGVITFNQSYTFASGSEIIFDHLSEFAVEAGNTLALSGSYLHGCDYSWKGITVKYGATIRLNGNTIKDADVAIRMKVDNTATPSGISATNNTFSKNYTGIYMEGLLAGAPKTINRLVLA
ncbi:MAG: hypothetical protein R3D58_18935 [Saprospiraceae bacterium]